jgi:hypothetical protein
MPFGWTLYGTPRRGVLVRKPLYGPEGLNHFFLIHFSFLPVRINDIPLIIQGCRTLNRPGKEKKALFSLFWLATKDTKKRGKSQIPN